MISILSEVSYFFKLLLFINETARLFIHRYTQSYLSVCLFSALVGLLFPNKTDAAFANYHTWKAVGFTITFVYSNFLCVSTKLIVAMGLLVAAMILYSVVEIRVRRKQGQNNEPTLEVKG